MKTAELVVPPVLRAEKNDSGGTLATDTATIKVYPFLKSLGMPGLRLCESDPGVKKVLFDKGFAKTPDLICGPDDLNNATLDGLFFIDVNEPSGDFLFKKVASEKRELKNNISQIFSSLLDGDKFDFGLDQLPRDHYPEYVAALNNKVDKYSFSRRINTNIATNTGIIQFFDIGEVTWVSTGNELLPTVENQNRLFTLIDYLNFYTKLESTSEKKILAAAINYLLTELTAKEPKKPYLILLPRDSQVPVLFLMIHIITYRKEVRYDLGIMMVNTTYANNDNYAICKWLVDIHEKSQTESIDAKSQVPIRLHVLRDKLPFE